MGYLHIDNLYRPEAQRILQFKEVYALEKIHGTSAHVAWRDDAVHFFSGGEKHDRFVSLFDAAALASGFAALGHEKVTVFGEAYGGKQQGQSRRYGPDLRFVAFDVRIGDVWLAVPQAEAVARGLGLDFVHYVKVPTDLASLDAERDAPSEQARRNGVEGDQQREGVVIRPPFEVTTNKGERLIAKHKRDEERETKTPRKVVDPAQHTVLVESEAIAEEWVTPTRLAHVLDKLDPDAGMERTRDVIEAMCEDVFREGRGEVIESREARTAIGRKTATLFKAYVRRRLTEVAA